MQSSSSHFIVQGLSLHQIQKFIPKKWKQTGQSVQGKVIANDESIIETLFTSLKDFSNQGDLLKAFKTFSIIQHKASSTDCCDLILHSISSLLSSCTHLHAQQQGEQLHTQIISLGFEQHPICVPKLVTFYSAFNFLHEAQTVTENSNIFHPLPWNLLISLYVRNGLHDKAISVYKQMVNRGIRIDNYTYPSILKACGENMDLDMGKMVHESIEANSLDWNLYVHNALISMYGKFGEVNVARDLFDTMPERDDVSWNAMINCYASKGKWDEAFELFEKMRVGGNEVSFITWNTIAGGCLRTNNFRGALDLLSQMRFDGMRLDSVSMIIGLSACSHVGANILGKEIHGSAIRSCYDALDNVRNALITMYSRCKELKHAHVLFQLAEVKSIITWNSMLSGYTHLDQWDEASFLFREMLLSEIEPNYVTIASILPLCARVANLQHGKEFHSYILRREVFKDYLLLWNTLVDVYARSGKIIAAMRLFQSMSKKDEVTYTSLISGCGMQGEGQVALNLFEEMIKSQIKPDHITMVAVLSACSHSRLVTEGQMLFDKMWNVYGIFPMLEHYACMVDLYGRAGFFNRAREMIKNMPYMPSADMWATLLGACRIHGNIEVGEWVAEKLLEMQPENPGYYVLIANMYAAAGCWSKLAKVRTFMRDLGVRKAPGCSWVDVGTGFSSFSATDMSSSQSNEIYYLLDGLNELMKDACNFGTGSDNDVLEELE